MCFHGHDGVPVVRRPGRTPMMVEYSTGWPSGSSTLARPAVGDPPCISPRAAGRPRDSNEGHPHPIGAGPPADGRARWSGRPAPTVTPMGQEKRHLRRHRCVAEHDVALAHIRLKRRAGGFSRGLRGARGSPDVARRAHRRLVVPSSASPAKYWSSTSPNTRSWGAAWANSVIDDCSF